MPAAAVVAGATVIGGMMSSQAAKSAAKQQASAITNAQNISTAAANKARSDILEIMAPAMTQYVQNLQGVEGTIKSGTVDIMNIFKNSTANASEILRQGGINAQQALLGGKAQAEGIPRQQFLQSYSADQAFGNIPTGIASTATTGIDAVKADDARSAALAEEQARIQADRQQQIDLIRAQNPNYNPGAATGLARFNQDNLASRATQPGQPTQAAQITGMASMPVVAGGTTMQAAAQPTAQPTLMAATQAVQPVSTLATTAAQPTVQSAGYSIPGGESRFMLPAVSTQSQPGYYDATGKIVQGYQTGLGQLARGAETARSDINQGLGSSLGAISQARGDITSQYNPYMQAGQQALQQEAALSGALGADAQQAAIDAFTESPGQKYLREQQEKALLRNTAAIGGLGGGNVRSALQEQAMNIAATQQQQYLENLRSLGVQGLSATGGYSGAIQNLTGQTVGAQQTAAQNLAQIANTLGINAAQLSQASASELSALSERTGVRLADLQSAQAAAQAQLQTGLGGSLASTYGGGLADIARLQEQEAMGLYGGQTNIAQILANLATSSGTQLAGLEANKGSALATGTQSAGNTYANMISGLGNIAGYGLANEGDFSNYWGTNKAA